MFLTRWQCHSLREYTKSRLRGKIFNSVFGCVEVEVCVSFLRATVTNYHRFDVAESNRNFFSPGSGDQKYKINFTVPESRCWQVGDFRKES